jgi:thiamine-monophosphate kinase
MPYQTENELLKALQKTFAKTHENVVVGIGDDAAVVKQSKEKLLVYTCDSQVENTHFKTTEIDPTQLGFRGMTAGISDIAAMGATRRSSA